jgi:hypothetical protein
VNFCPHITQAREAQRVSNFAEAVSVDVESLLARVSEETLEKVFRDNSSDGEIVVHVLPGGNLAVPLLDTEKTQFMTDYVHLRDLKCNIDACSKKVKSKLHSLVVKGVPVCRHSLLGKEL